MIPWDHQSPLPKLHLYGFLQGLTTVTDQQATLICLYIFVFQVLFPVTLHFTHCIFR